MLTAKPLSSPSSERDKSEAEEKEVGVMWVIMSKMRQAWIEMKKIFEIKIVSIDVDRSKYKDRSSLFYDQFIHMVFSK